MSIKGKWNCGSYIETRLPGDCHLWLVCSSGQGPGQLPQHYSLPAHPDFPRQSPPPAVSAAVLGSRASGVPLAGRPGLCRQPWAGKAKRTLQERPALKTVHYDGSSIWQPPCPKLYGIHVLCICQTRSEFTTKFRAFLGPSPAFSKEK